MYLLSRFGIYCHGVVCIVTVWYVLSRCGRDGSRSRCWPVVKRLPCADLIMPIDRQDFTARHVTTMSLPMQVDAVESKS